MRHRIGIAAYTGLGNPNPELIRGRSGSRKRDALINDASKECYELFFKGHKQRGIDLGGVDAGVTAYSVRIGIEPTYMYWPLKILEICEDKELSNITTGYSWGAYGSGLRTTRRRYQDAKRRGKFVQFVDKWHPILFPKK